MSYLSLKKHKNAQLDQLLKEQSKERVKRKLPIVEKSFKMQREQRLEETFEAESKAQVEVLGRNRKSSLNNNESV